LTPAAECDARDHIRVVVVFDIEQTWLAVGPLSRARRWSGRCKTRAARLWYDVRMTAMSRATLRRLVRARDVLHADVRRGATLDELAAAAGLSRAFLARSFARTFGAPPHQYLVRSASSTPSARSPAARA
jgi:methylphosphotriester-DNA--protein-cysteine methyltransferase